MGASGTCGPCIRTSSAVAAGGTGQLVAEELAEGWLAFEAAGAPAEKRRLAPVPPEWEQFPPPMLIELWERATAVRARLDVHVVP